ncbi:CBS domain-containing protein [Streptomyces cavernicola]|uniref:CBS domain-containing protein n=1 Tax=Streptomyces cavernicola TaxID=3043613 RepID=A0ABT6SF81_9ACTN|nr:CBS domain-containing protein [Streptomyces sp. B-S-A6]MDI3406862.1 CBS domain-containing protein [Streptomyces sp. B-S-A6]
MRHRSVADLMTPTAVSVAPETTFKEIARLLDEYDITAVPVVDEADRPLGVVSEADLVRRRVRGSEPDAETSEPDAEAEAGDAEAESEPGAARIGRAGADTAAGLMSSPAVVARPRWSVVRAARTMDRAKVKRLPVVDDEGRLIGVLSRSDLVQLFLRRDRAIQEEIVEDVITQTLRLSPSALTVEVTEGRVTLSGSVRDPGLVPVLLRLCDSVDGVVTVVDRLQKDQKDHDVPAGK